MNKIVSFSVDDEQSNQKPKNETASKNNDTHKPFTVETSPDSHTKEVDPPE